MRDYHWRKHHQERVVKSRILDIAYPYKMYRMFSYRRSNIYSSRDPEDKWFNYLGEYTPRYKTSTGEDNRRWHGYECGYQWKAKYGGNRPKSKEKIKKLLNDQIGERYYIFDK